MRLATALWAALGALALAACADSAPYSDLIFTRLQKKYMFGKYCPMADASGRAIGNCGDKKSLCPEYQGSRDDVRCFTGFCFYMRKVVCTRQHFTPIKKPLTLTDVLNMVTSPELKAKLVALGAKP